MQQVTVEEAQARLPELVAAAAAGEEVVIVNDSKPAVKLVPVAPHSRPQPQFGSARGLIVLADDFDAPLDDFREYTE
jgi:prevent-host-death family protein